MADFLPKTNFDPNAPNWTGASRTPDRRDYAPDRTYETLFSGATEMAVNATNAAYGGVVQEIKDDWQSRRDYILDGQGVGAAVDGTSVGTGQPGNGLDINGKPRAGIPPNETEAFAKEAARLKQGLKEGVIGDSYYTQQLEAATRAIKAKYPGFRDEIDAIVHKTTGITPANAVRNTLLKELEARQSAADAEAKEQRSYALKNEKHWTPSMRENAAKGILPTIAELSPIVAQNEGEERMVNAAKGRIQLAQDRGALDTREAKSGLIGHLQLIQGQFASQILDPLRDKISTALANGGKITDPNLVAELSSMAININLEMDKALRAAIHGTDGKGGKSWAQLIADPTEVEKIRKEAMQPLEELRDAIHNEKYGLAVANLKTLEWGRDQRMRRVLEEHPEIRNMATVMTIPGAKEIVPLIFQNTPGISGPVIKGLTEAFGMKAIQGKGNITEQLKEMGLAGSTSVENKAAIQRYVDMIRNEQVPPEIKANIAKFLFTPEALQGADKKDELFRMLSNQAVTQEMLKLKESHPEVWDNYSKWTKNAFFNGFRQTFADINSATSNQYVAVKWDPNLYQFTVAPTEAGAELLARSPWRSARVLSPIEALMENNHSVKSLVDSLNKFNELSKPIVTLLKGDGVADINEEMLNLFKAAEIRPDGPKDKPLMQRLGEAIRSTYDKLQAQPKVSEGIAQSMAGHEINFQSASGGKEGTGSTFSLGGSEVKPLRGANLQGLAPRTQQFLKDLAADGVVATLNITSGHRTEQQNADAGGAEDSKHLTGEAIDISVKGMTDEQKTALLEAVIKRGAKGIGIYPSGTSIHVDMRSTPATWGYSTFGAYRGVNWNQQPAWAHGPLKKLFGIQDKAEGPRMLDEVIDEKGNVIDGANVQRTTFAGENAKGDTTGERARSLELAKRLKEQGLSKEEIYKLTSGEDRTGWVQGPDNKWRFEIDDSTAKIAPNPKRIIESGIATLGDVLKHPMLYTLYPEAANIRVRLLTDSEIAEGFRGFYDRSKNTISIEEEALSSTSTFLHEVQHFIQKNEGFGSGGNADTARIMATLYDKSEKAFEAEYEKKYQEARRKMYASDKSEDIERYGEEMKNLTREYHRQRDEREMKRNQKLKGLSAFEAYRRLSGETESRNVQTRRGMTLEERRNTLPEATADYKDEDTFPI